MFKIVVIYDQPSDPEHFKSYYVEKHLPLAAQLPGILSSTYSFDVQGMGPHSPVFAIWVGEFPDAAAAGAAMASEIGQKVAADAPNYTDGGFTLLQFTADEV